MPEFTEVKEFGEAMDKHRDKIRVILDQLEKAKKNEGEQRRKQLRGCKVRVRPEFWAQVQVGCRLQLKSLTSLTPTEMRRKARLGGEPAISEFLSAS